MDKIRRNGTCPIVFHIYVNGRTSKFFLKGEYVNPNLWDDVKGRAKGKGYGLLNDLIDKKEEDIKDFMRQHKIQDTIPTKKDIKEFWNGVGGYNDDYFAFFEDFYVRHLSDKAEGTVKHYNNLRKKLKGFRKDLKLSEINYDFMVEYEAYLKTTESGVDNMIKFFKTTLNDALKNKYIKDDSWKNLQRKKGKSKEVALNPEEFRKIIDFDVTYDPTLQEVKDMFLFSYYTSLSHCDLLELTKDKIKDNTIIYVRKKLRKYESKVAVPLTENALEILNKYADAKANDEPIFTIQNTYTNKKLRELAKIVGIKKKFSFHSARHSFATRLASSGVNTLIISKSMGHTNPKQTYGYVNADVNTMKEVLNNTAFI